ncbi:hypothetical protein [Amycolatopsis pigmentata]|uniref:Leucine-binding protein domain-containing protein n=1 Tax=Amycolatopsis pigmentata TaxID=450801 RepID=A0ABW5G1Y3_9PSEU
MKNRLAFTLTAAVTAAVAMLGSACSATTGGSSNGSGASNVDAVSPGVTGDMINVTRRGFDGDVNSPIGRMFTAVLNYYNQQGGVAGHKLNPVPMPSGNETDPKASQAEVSQKDCLAISQANPKIYAVLGDAFIPGFDSCLSSHGIAVVLSGNLIVPDDLTSQAPYAAGLGITPRKAAEAMTAVLGSTGYLTGAGNVAVVDVPEVEAYQPAVRNTLIPALRKAGAGKVTEYSLPGAGTDPAADKAAAANLVLRMNAEHVDRVVLFGEAPGLAAVTKQMISQKFTPRIAAMGGMISEGPKSTGLGDAPADVLQQFVGVGWSADTATPDQLTKLTTDNTAARKCAQILTDAHLSDENDLLRGLSMCDSLNLFIAALAHADPQHLNAKSFADGVGKVGDFDATTTFKAKFSDTEHAGVNAYKRVEYQSACKCFVSTGDPVAING